MSLLSTSELAAVQELAESGMTTAVQIYHGAKTVTDNGQSWGYPATADLTVLGWMTEITPNSTRMAVMDGLTTLSETHRLFTPVGTDIRSGDKVVVKGVSFIVQHTNAENTYPTWAEAALRTLV